MSTYGWAMVSAGLQKSVFIVFVSLALQGCILLQTGFHTATRSDFDGKRDQLKKDAERKLISAEQAALACRTALQTGGDQGYAAPLPYPDEICTFGSFADRRYELTRAFNQGDISQETWEQVCLALPNRPKAGTPCHLDQLTEMLAAWRQRIQEGRTTKEAVQWDCLKWVASHKGDNVMKERCEIKDI
ncbi:hypothetical protein [Petrachloros mirabilis]